jgi:tRNA A-37 threonylcarbamoyl transferase component Bud32
VGALVPKVYDIDVQEQKFLMELVNKHEGRLRIRTATKSSAHA